MNLNKSILGLNHNEKHQDKNNNGLYPKEQTMLNYINEANIDRVVFFGVSWILQHATDPLKDKVKKHQDTYEENLRRLICVLHQNNIEVSAAINYGLTQTDTMTENPVNWHDYQVQTEHMAYANGIGHDWVSGHQCDQQTAKRDGDDDDWRGDSVTLFPEQYAHKVSLYETDSNTILDTVIIENYEPVLPRDNRGVMSPIDNMTIQARNLSLYQRRAKKQHTGEHLEGDVDDPGRCAMFDRAITEYEFWKYNDTVNKFSEYKNFKQVFDEYMKLVRYAKRLNDHCEFHKYTLDVYLGHLRDSAWHENGSAPAGYKEEELADSIDKEAGRVYVVNYREKPCDLFMHHVFNDGFGGTSSLDTVEDFHHLYKLFANNGKGSANGKTKILPILNVEHECLPDSTGLDGEEHLGKYLWGEDCRGEQAMDSNKSALGRVEGIFNRIKDNWEADQTTNHDTSYDNKLNGFQWFIYRHMNFSNSSIHKKEPVGRLESKTFNLRVFPNPVENGNQLKVAYQHDGPLRYKIYSSTGQTVKRRGTINQNGAKAIRVGNLAPGIYHLVVNNNKGSRVTKKIVVLE